MKEIAVVLLVAANILMALHHNDLIEQGKKIKHGLWGLAYFGFATLLAFLNHSFLLFAVAFPIRKIVFDLSLNLFRGKALFYVSPNPKSLIDKWHNKIFGLNSIPYMVFYFISSIVLTIFL